MATLREEVDGFMSGDPLHAVRIGYTYLLVQCVGSILAAGANPDDLRECFDEALAMAVAMMASTDSKQTAGQQLDHQLREAIQGKSKLIIQ